MAFESKLPVRLESFVATTNSSNTALGANGVFTGSAWIDMQNYAQMTITVRSNVAGVLSVQRSGNGGATIGQTITYSYAGGSVGMPIIIPYRARYVRIVYANGATQQTTFALNVAVHTTATGFTFQTIDAAQNDDTVVLNTLSNLAGKRITDGVYSPIPLMADSSLSVTAIPYIYAIAEGDIPGHSIQIKMGYSPASTGSQTTLWNPGTEYVFPTGAISVEAVSTDNTNDKAGGTGALTVHLVYLKADYTEATHTFTMNGTTAVAGPTDFFRVNSFHVETGGPTAGVVSLRLVGGAATVYSQMPVGATRARNSVFTVPAGKTFYVESIHFTAAYSSSGKSVRMSFHASQSPEGTVSNTGRLFWPLFEAMLVDGTTYDPSEAPIAIKATTDIKVSVVGETNAKTTCRYSGWIE